VDWHSRAVLAWRLSNSMDGSFCVSALEEALARFGKPDIFNTDSKNDGVGSLSVIPSYQAMNRLRIAGQWTAASPGPWRSDADGGLARRHVQPGDRHGCGHDAALGQRWRAVHMPTTATAATSSLMTSADRSGPTSN
jgi:transposase InsO family protein